MNDDSGREDAARREILVQLGEKFERIAYPATGTAEARALNSARVNADASTAKEDLVGGTREYDIRWYEVALETYDFMLNTGAYTEPRQMVDYDTLTEGLKANLALGHVLADHTVTRNGITHTHLTTVQLSIAYDADNRSVHYCNDVCGDMCEPGSVQIRMIQMPKTPIATTEAPLPFDTGKVRVGVDFIAVPSPEEMEKIEAAAALDDDLDDEGPVVLPPLRVLREAKLRLEVLKAWLYEGYRAAIHTARFEGAQDLSAALFVLSTGKQVGDDNELFATFMEFLYDSVVLQDAAEMPEWEADCGV